MIDIFRLALNDLIAFYIEMKLYSFLRSMNFISVFYVQLEDSILLMTVHPTI